MKIHSLAKPVIAVFLLFLILISFGVRIFYEVQEHSHQCDGDHCAFCTFNEYTKNNFRKIVFTAASAAYFLFYGLKSFNFLILSIKERVKEKTLTELKVRLNN
jgi:predicted glycosyl hydrolase (DUF1957 family)